MFVEVPGLAPAVGPSSFILNATPAVNLFSHDAHPIRVDHLQPDYRIRPIARGSRSVEQIFSVDSVRARAMGRIRRSEEHTSELQSLMRISYAVFCLKKKQKT